MLLEQKVEETYTSKITDNFNYFDKFFTDLLTQSFADFWEKNYQLKLVSICDDNFSLFKTEEFFVTKIPLKKNLHIGIRTSKTAIKILFECLGEPLEDFDIRKITEIEAKIINSFNEFVYQSFKKYTDVPSKKYSQEPKSINLIFYLVHNDEIGKYIVTLPKEVIRLPQLEQSNLSIDINKFLKTLTQVDIHVGSTKMTLSDLKNLAIEDIVLLDDSNINTMLLKAGGQLMNFQVAPDPTLIMNLEDNGENEMADNSTTSQNMWDNIQVEIGAEFDKVKISLGELKQISEGIVVDVGSVYENKIFLKVENKNIAQGELVIINDRYGVRIDKLLNDEETVEENDNVQMQQQNLPPGNVEPQQQESGEEDFDYSDFEIEDENI